MKKNLINIVKIIATYATHIITCILMQMMLLIMLAWFYDTSIKEYIVNTSLSIAFLLADYVINSLLQHNTNQKTKTKCLLHTLDLIFAVPNTFIVVENILRFQGITPIDVITLVVNALLVAERIILIRKKGRELPSSNV
ncbi:MAG: hypothetical protein J1E60_05190 [Christensenellaceae bacterium]|nr:hypothetical protein [Christensenellaceae bacterium]